MYSETGTTAFPISEVLWLNPRDYSNLCVSCWVNSGVYRAFPEGLGQSPTFDGWVNIWSLGSGVRPLHFTALGLGNLLHPRLRVYILPGLIPLAFDLPHHSVDCFRISGSLPISFSGFVISKPGLLSSQPHETHLVTLPGRLRLLPKSHLWA